eukprot:2844243-Amphidinium_carterae.1
MPPFALCSKSSPFAAPSTFRVLWPTPRAVSSGSPHGALPWRVKSMTLRCPVSRTLLGLEL